MDTIDSERTASHDADTRLIAALMQDLDGAFPTLVTDHQDRLYSIALRMLGDPHDAEEAAQDALVRAYRAMATYDPTRIADLRLRGWLATIVLNLCRNRLARHGGRAGMARSLDDPDARIAEPGAPASQAPESIAQRRDEREVWGARLLRLPPAYRAAVVLRHVDGLSYPEAAIALGRPEGTVKAQVHRGIALLRTMLEAEARSGHEEMTA